MENLINIFKVRRITKSNLKRVFFDFLYAAYIVFIAHLVFVVFLFCTERNVQIVQLPLIEYSGLIPFFLNNLDLIGAVLCDAVITGIVEELIFTGLIFFGLSRFFVSHMANGTHQRTFAMLSTAALFSIAHLIGLAQELQPDIGYMFLKLVQAFLFSVCMIKLLIRTGPIYGPIIVHAAFDFFYFLVPCILTQKASEAMMLSDGLIPDVALITLATTTLLLLPAALWRTRVARPS